MLDGIGNIDDGEVLSLSAAHSSSERVMRQSLTKEKAIDRYQRYRRNIEAKLCPPDDQLEAENRPPQHRWHRRFRPAKRDQNQIQPAEPEETDQQVRQRHECTLTDCFCSCRPLSYLLSHRKMLEGGAPLPLASTDSRLTVPHC